MRLGERVIKLNSLYIMLDNKNLLRTYGHIMHQLPYLMQLRNLTLSQSDKNGDYFIKS